MYGFRWGIGVVVALLLSSTPARAQDPWEQDVTAQQVQHAHLHFRLALELHKQLLLKEAAAEYQRALSYWEHPKIYFYLSRVWMKLGQAVAAYEALREALRWGRRGLTAHDYVMARQMRQELLKKHVAELEVRCNVAGAEVTLDGALLFVGPGRRRVTVSSGKHQLVAKQPEHLTETHDIAIFPGEQQQITIKPREIGEYVNSTRRWARWKPWAVVGSGLAVAMTGGLMHRLSAEGFAAYDHEFTLRCGGFGGCLDAEIPALNERLHRARTQQRFAVASYAVGGLALAYGVILLSLNEPKTSIVPSSNLERSGIFLMPMSPLSPGFGISVGTPF